MWPTLFKIPWIHWPIRGYGMMLMIGFLGGAWWAARRASRVKADPDACINVTFVGLIASVIGARLFYVMHYWDDHFAGRGLWAMINVSAGGLEFYGGFIGAALAGLAYIRLRGYSMRLYLDLIAPSIMFGMAAARIGCFLNGCCWGGPCDPQTAWAVRFPYGSPALYRQWEERQTTLPAELIHISAAGVASPLPRDLLGVSTEEREGAAMAYGRAVETLEAAKTAGADQAELARLRQDVEQARKQRDEAMAMFAPLRRQMARFDLTPTEIDDLGGHHRSLHVHPVQLYASINGLVLAVLLNAYFYRRKRHGMVFALLLLTYPALRIVEEMIRIDNPHDTAGLTISQFVSVLLLLSGVAMVVALRRMPLRSPRAVPYVPPPPPGADDKGNKGRR